MPFVPVIWDSFSIYKMGITNSAVQGCFANQIENRFKESAVGSGANQWWLFLFFPALLCLPSVKGLEQDSATAGWGGSPGLSPSPGEGWPPLADMEVSVTIASWAVSHRMLCDFTEWLSLCILHNFSRRSVRGRVCGEIRVIFPPSF